MNSLRIMGPKQIKAERLVAMAVHVTGDNSPSPRLSLSLTPTPSNIFTLFMKYFISSIANAKYKSQGDAACLFQLELGNASDGGVAQLLLRKGWAFVHQTDCVLFSYIFYSKNEKKKNLNKYN